MNITRTLVWRFSIVTGGKRVSGPPLSKQLFVERYGTSSNNTHTMETPVIETKLGKVRGKVASDYLGGKYYSFQGIPYAKAPIGDLRFKAPKPVEPWSEELDATKEGPECPSLHLMFLTHIGKEDNCLNLNVYIKELPEEEPNSKPVMVFIHGGAFIQGSNTTEFYGPEYLMTRDAVQVIINYRVGVLGFLCLEDESLGVTGNAGLKDQVLALKWVKENIESFGGDPNNVTIYGESAGAASVHYLVISPQAKGLFNKAILQSGSVLNVWAQGQRGAAHITKKLGIKETDEAVILEKLNNTCAKKLISAQMKVTELMTASTRRVYGPVIEKPSEDAFLAEEPIDLLKSGNYNKVPMMIGMTSNEGLLYEVVRQTRRLKGSLDLETEIPYEIGAPPKSEAALAISEKIKKFYGIDKNKIVENLDSIYLLKSDHHFVHGIHRTLEYHLLTNDNPIYYYMFSFEGECNYFRKFATSKHLIIYFMFHYFVSCSGRETIKNLFIRMGNGMGFRNSDGCCHADDLGYLFKSFYSQNIVPESREQKFMESFLSMWTNFARYGNPIPEEAGGDLGIQWKPAEKGCHHYMDLGETLKMKTNPFEDRMKFWDEIYKEYSNN